MTTINDKAKWLKLYDTAKAYQKLAPWNWMGDAQVFGVEDPETKALNFCVVFGRGGVVYGLNVYKGIIGLDSYLNILNLSPFENPLFTQRAVALAFEDRGNLTKEDYQHIKNLGLKFRGKKQWIQFLDMTPGYHPWVIEENQVDMVQIAIEQTIEVAKLVKANPKLITDDYLMMNHTDDILIRRFIDGKWQNTFVNPEKMFEDWENSEDDEVSLSKGLVAKLYELKDKFPVAKYVLINGFEYLQASIQEDKTQRPYYTTLALWIRYSSQAILGQNLGSVKEAERLLYESLLGIVMSYERIPAQIVVSNDVAYDYLYPLEELWGIEVIYNPNDMLAKSIMAELTKYLG